MQCRRGGYALLAVLWICAGVAGLGMMVSVAGTYTTSAARNRIELIRAEWHADGCVAWIRGIVAAAMREELGGLRQLEPTAWIQVDEILADSRRLEGTGCRYTADPAGTRLDVNAADEATLAAVLHAGGESPASADSLAAAIADWMDADTVPRPTGAERAWYGAQGLPGPGNGPFRSRRELSLVRGMEAPSGVIDLLDVEPAAVSINHAAPAILVALPGFSAEIVDWVEVRRRSGPLRSFSDLSDDLWPSARQELAAALPRLAPVATFEPAAWVVTVRSGGGDSGVRLLVEIRLERRGSSVAIIRRRSWIQ